MNEDKIIEWLGDAVEYDSDGQHFWAKYPNGGIKMVAQLRGWGAIQKMFEQKGGKIDFEAAIKFQDEVGEWIADAINKKLQSK